MTFINQILQYYKKIKGDPRTRLALAFIRSGTILLSGGLFFSFTGTSITPEGGTITFTVTTGDIGLLASGLGILLIFSGISLSRHHFKSTQQKTKALFFFPAFSNLNTKEPIEALPTEERNSTEVITFKNFDSYDPKKIIEEYNFSRRRIEDRLDHQNIESAYIAALGSVPFIFLTGTLFRNGHIPTTTLEHDRTNDRWHLLDDLGGKRSVAYKYLDYDSRDAVIKALEDQRLDDIGMSISFTCDIKKRELPPFIRSRTINLSLDTENGYDVLPCEEVQKQIVKEICHFIATISKLTSKIHFFISAQSSVVFKIGRLYQDGMMGKVSVYNYDAKSKQYNWSIIFDGTELTTEPVNNSEAPQD